MAPASPASPRDSQPGQLHRLDRIRLHDTNPAAERARVLGNTAAAPAKPNRGGNQGLGVQLCFPRSLKCMQLPSIRSVLLYGRQEEQGDGTPARQGETRPMEGLDLESVIERARGHDAESLGEIYHRYVRRVFGLSRYMLDSPLAGTAQPRCGDFAKRTLQRAQKKHEFRRTLRGAPFAFVLKGS
jgi:hypothetical protein